MNKYSEQNLDVGVRCHEEHQELFNVAVEKLNVAATEMRNRGGCDHF